MRNADALDARVLAMLSPDSPTGARTIWREILNQGINVSESTVGRVLGELDARGLTASLGNKGRTLTSSGQQLLETTRAEDRRREQFVGARTIRSTDDLLDLLYVRRGVELVAVRAAAARATPAEIARLKVLARGAESSSQPNQWFEPISFHKCIGQCSHNKPVQAISEALFEDKFDVQERMIYLIGCVSGTWVHSGPDHGLIADAIAGRDPDAAEAHMTTHLDGIIRTVEDFARQTSQDVLDQLIASAETRSEPK